MSILVSNCFDHGWPDTHDGDTVELPCNRTGTGKVTRLCTLHGWDEPDFSQCGMLLLSRPHPLVDYIPCDNNSKPRVLTLLSTSLMCKSEVIVYAMTCVNNKWNVTTKSFDCCTSSHSPPFPSDSQCRRGIFCVSCSKLSMSWSQVQGSGHVDL